MRHFFFAQNGLLEATRRLQDSLVGLVGTPMAEQLPLWVLALRPGMRAPLMGHVRSRQSRRGMGVPLGSEAFVLLGIQHITD